MKKITIHIYKVLRNVFVTVLLTLLTIYSALYITLSLPGAQNRIREIGEKELSKLLDTKVSIGNIQIYPLDEIMLNDVNMPDKSGAQLLHVDKIGAGISLYELIFNQRFVFNYAEIIGLNAHISKDTPKSPLNIQFIIDALKPKDKNKPPTKFDIALNAVVIRRSTATFDVFSEGHAAPGRFDKNHIKVTQLNADIYIPKLKNDDFSFVIKRLAFRENSGFTLRNLALNIDISKTSIAASGLRIELPNSRIEPADIQLKFADLKKLKNELHQLPLALKIKEALISPADFKAFVPALSKADIPLFLSCDIDGNLRQLNVRRINVHTNESWLTLNTSGTLRHLNDKDSLAIDIPNIKLHADMTAMAGAIPEEGAKIVNTVKFVSIDGSLQMADKKAKYVGYIHTALGRLVTNGTLAFGKVKSFTGRLSSDNLILSQFTPNKELLGDASFDLLTNLSIIGKKPIGTVKGKVRYIDLKGYRYENIVTDLKLGRNSYEGFVTLEDPNIDFNIHGMALLDGENSKFDMKASISNVSPYNLHWANKYENHRLSLGIDAMFTGDNPDNIEGDIMVSDIAFRDDEGNGVSVSHLDLTSRTKENNRKYMTLNSDLINGHIDGYVNFAHLVPELKEIVAVALPAIKEVPQQDPKQRSKKLSTVKATRDNNFSYFFRIAENNDITEFFHLPVTIVHPITLSGSVNAATRNLRFGLDMPYLMQGDKVIEKTNIALQVDGAGQSVSLNAATQLDHKNGNILFLINANGADDCIDTDIAWQYDRTKNFSGNLRLTSLLQRNEENNALTAGIQIHPSKFIVNDTTWNIEQSKIDVAKNRIIVENIDVNREHQFVHANGIVSDNMEETLELELKNIDLDYIFETLKINHVVFGGSATGRFHASGLLTKQPQINTPNLHVENFAYHEAPLGTADIASYWDNETKGIVINADIHQYNGRESFVRGAVYPTIKSLSFKFFADHLNVAILKPFMSAFTSDVEGEASGQAHLFGTFKQIDMEGRLFADRFRMRVDQTNCYYNVSDSIIMDPGSIRVTDAVVKDDYGNTAKLNGKITHTYFKDAEFEFDITDVNNMLCFNTTERENPFWYGKIFGNGAAYILGRPGNVNINVNMSSAPNSSFTFVLSDQEEASEYNFITFTDSRKKAEQEKEEAEKPEFLKKLEVQQNNAGGQSLFHINLLVDANPNVAMTLVMDPNGGDRIRATGSGNMRIEYDSADGMKMFGNYTVNEGKYNFTLQDIIVREFKIKQGATIAFHGDPMDAVVDLAATYSVNANLEDLDESFAQDKDLNRTLVPVNALLKLSGVISQPDISFDLEFPSLTQDVYRKVRSIVSTEDLMNQQIIYLLALSRFYTPEYMGGTNRNNGLASVASSTISSQLSNILGQLSDNWTIAPNFRSEKGDFSDTEVELALSSHLLNNRLLLNGNFGYSDNAMNNNSFIGDFDIEYLLTKSGNFRLKAYNRYNDQNYYIRNALTTQGVGIMFKHDFDSLFPRKRRKKEKLQATEETIPADSLPQMPHQRDSLPADSERLPVKRD